MNEIGPPDPDVKISHNEWYAVSWEMDFGKQIDEHETSESTRNNHHVEIQEVTNTNDDDTTPQTSNNHSGDTNDVAPSSPDFSNLTTDVGITHTYAAPHPLKVHLFPQDHQLQLWDITQGK